MSLVTVVTPTWQRHDLLMGRCVQSVYAQTYPSVEHIIVSDGPDRELAMLVSQDLWRRPLQTRPLRFLQLSEHLDGPVDYGSRARNHGLAYASGEYVAYLDDDNAYRPEHLRLLVRALKRDPLADFAYARMLCHPTNSVIGAETPIYGGIDTSLLIHRRGVPQKFGLWPLPGEIDGDKHAPDWGVVSRWLDNGARWTRINDVTVDYFFAT